MIAVDWGSTSLRAMQLDADGQVREVRRSGQGIIACDGRYAEVLGALLDGWDDPLVLMVGMVGSRQGRHEIPYVACPAGLPELAAAMQPLPDALPGRQVWLAAGQSVQRAGGEHDVMRGEETQVCGMLPSLPPGPQVVCMAGTHCKHVHIVDGRIVAFATLMTGGLFQLLCQHSLLGRLMQPGPHDADAFEQGLQRAGQDPYLLQQLFTVRSRGLFEQLQPVQLASYLSGLLIGHELAALPAAPEVQLVASDALAPLYTLALQRAGRRVRLHDETVTARGLHALAVQRGAAAGTGLNTAPPDRPRPA
ncbi:MAG: putative 2-dehydro-3-deoxygalactonokinase DgoK1 [Stenotrophomonas maltophilia]|nr:MAG: putative 2-dehydro-3-deoxygalactonokinase DgoK1 [Stenotrophomonas maltophilia]